MRLELLAVVVAVALAGCEVRPPGLTFPLSRADAPRCLAPMSDHHRGTDWQAAPGTAVHAPFDGRVVLVGREPSRSGAAPDHPHAVGITVIIDHLVDNRATRTVLTPLAEVAVGLGDHVTEGAVVGRTGPEQLHVEVRGPVPYDPWSPAEGQLGWTWSAPRCTAP